MRLMCVLALAAFPAIAEDRPDPGLLNDRVYVPALDGVCGVGQDRLAGCDAIRARPILDAAQKPWSAIGRLNFGGLDQRGHCTGTLVAPAMVLTAGHCLYNQRRKAWMPADSFVFVAGFQRGTAVARARAVSYVLAPVQDPESRDYRGDFATDWALVQLDTAIGNDAGWLPLWQSTDRPEADAKVQMAGYPALRGNVLSLAEDCAPWLVDPLTQLGIGRCSSMPGDSGAPMLIATSDGQLAVTGVHSGMVTDVEGKLLSAAVHVDAFRDAVGD